MGLLGPRQHYSPPRNNDAKFSCLPERPTNKLEESCRTRMTSDSTSTFDDPDSPNNSHSESNNNNDDQFDSKRRPLHQQHTLNLSTNLLNELTSLHTSTHQAIQLSYMEQEHLSNNINTMQSRISYLKRKIGKAREELIAKGGEDMGEELLRLSLVKEVEDSSVSDYDDERNNFEVTYESFKPYNDTPSNSNNNNKQRKGLLKKVGSQNSGMSSGHNSSQEESDVVSGASSIFRITFGGVDGMPSRWRAREVEREKSEELAKKKEEEEEKCDDGNLAKDDDDGVGGTGGGHKGKAAENTKEQQLKTLKQLVNERESEISFLEREMMSVEKEKALLEDEISRMKNKVGQSKTGTKNDERKELCGDIHECQLDNRKLEKELLETTVSLSVNKMNIELLGNELREARDEFLEIQKMRELEKKEIRRLQKMGSPPSECNPQSSQNFRVEKIAIQDTDQRKPGCARNTTHLSNSLSESVITMMSALTSDFSDLVDLLEDVDSPS